MIVGGTPFRNASRTSNVEALVSDEGHQLVDTYHQDHHSPAVIAYFHQIQNNTTLSVNAVRWSRTITVTDPTGFVAGTYVVLFNVSEVRFYLGTVVSVAGSVITLDTPLDSDFPAGSNVDGAIDNLNVDGSVTPQVFGLRGPGAIPGVELSFDITRIFIQCLTTDGVSLGLFGDLPTLTNGLVLRTRKNGDSYNLFNIKSNGGLAGIAYDWTPYSASNPQQGQNGFIGRLTFNGNDKMGVAIRLDLGEDLELVVQDDLSGLQVLSVVAEGHIVE